MSKVLTEKEKEVLNKIVEAHNLYLELEEVKDTQEWCEAIHKLQALLSLRLLRRIHPEIYK